MASAKADAMLQSLSGVTSAIEARANAFVLAYRGNNSG